MSVAHLLPLALLRQRVELVLQAAPAVQLEHGAVGGRRAVEGDLLAGAGGGRLPISSSLVPVTTNDGPDDLEAVHRLAGLGPAALERREGDLAQVLLGGEAVAEEAVAHLAGDLGHQLADAGEEDLRRRRTARSAAGGVKNGVISVCV